MPYNSNIMTSLYGRRLGLQAMTTAQTGGTRGVREYLVGPECMRSSVSTAESTATNLAADGVSVCPGTSAASSAVYTLDPPIIGVRKTIMGGVSNGPVYIKTANNETIVSTIGSSFTTVKISSLGGGFELIGLTTAVWVSMDLTSGTSSQASGFSLTTST